VLRAKGKQPVVDSAPHLTAEQQAILDKKFVDSSTKKTYQERFANRKVLIERGVKLTDLTDTFALVPRILNERHWEYFALSPISVYIEAVREFYCNITGFQDSPPSFTTYVRGREILVDRLLISNITNIPIIDEPDYPYADSEFPSRYDMGHKFTYPESMNLWLNQNSSMQIGDMAPPITLLARIMLQNIYPLQHHSDVNVQRGRFLYAMITGASIDFCSFVIQVIRDAYNETTTILPYPVLITRILANFDVEFLPSESTSDSQRPFSKATVSRSLGQISRKRQQGIASGNIGESFPDAATEFRPSLGIGPSSVQPSVPSESFTEMLSLLRSINKNQTEILTRLDNLEKASTTQSTQLKQLKLDVNNILGHVTPKEDHCHQCYSLSWFKL
jgi:hypothetical protein